jgi:F-type H+-transporting ATPase subunit delta
MRLPKRIANRYARALADVALERGQAEEIKDELKQFAALFAPGTAAHLALTAPGAALARRQEALDAIIERAKPLAATANFLRVLLKNHRFGNLSEISAAFEEELDRRRGIVRAEIETAHDLDDELRQELVAALESASGRKIRVVWRVAPDLIGGFRANVANTIFDGSVRGQLDRLREELLKGDLPTPRQETAWLSA